MKQSMGEGGMQGGREKERERERGERERGEREREIVRERGGERERGSGSKNDNDGCTREVMYLTDDRSIAIANTKAVNFMFHNNLRKWVNPSIP